MNLQTFVNSVCTELNKFGEVNVSRARLEQLYKAGVKIDEAKAILLFEKNCGMAQVLMMLPPANAIAQAEESVR